VLNVAEALTFWAVFVAPFWKPLTSRQGRHFHDHECLDSDCTEDAGLTSPLGHSRGSNYAAGDATC
jgi:hypothetical protein